MLPEGCLNKLSVSNELNQVNHQGGQERDTDADNVMCLERCYLLTTGKCISGYSNVAMPSDGSVHTHSTSEVQRLTKEPTGLQSIHLVFKHPLALFTAVHMLVSCVTFIVWLYKYTWRQIQTCIYRSVSS